MENDHTQTQQTTLTADARFYAQPYDITACGFFFVDRKDYDTKRAACRNSNGDLIEEFEIQFIDGDDLDAALFNALSVSQASLEPFIEAIESWTEDDKIRLIIAAGECGAAFDIRRDDPSDLDMDLYTDMTLSDLAYLFVDEGLFGDIPDHLSRYIDYDAIARDLAHDYTETTLCGVCYVYRLA